MRNRTIGRSGIVLLCVLLLFIATSVNVFGTGTQEEEYPQRPISIVVPWGPGGTSSVIAQMVAREAEEALGTRVQVVNQPGASGATGTLFVKDSPADGYTILQTWIAPMVQVPLMEDDAGFDPIEDFYHFARVSQSPVMIVTRADAPWDTVLDFVEDARENPGEYSFSGGGALSVHFLFFSELVRNADIDVRGVTYQGATASLPDLLGGTIDVASGTTTFLTMQPDELKAIGIFAEERHPDFPDVPTVKELGLEAPTVPAWSGLAVRQEVPDSIKERLTAVFEEILTSEEFIAEISGAANVDVSYLGPDDMPAFIEKSMNEMAPALERLKAQGQ
jgi:tripartite-type tricarboxylate transporter receptor subunit TctC